MWVWGRKDGSRAAEAGPGFGGSAPGPACASWMARNALADSLTPSLFYSAHSSGGGAAGGSSPTSAAERGFSPGLGWGCHLPSSLTPVVSASWSYGAGGLWRGSFFFPSSLCGPKLRKAPSPGGGGTACLVFCLPRRH